MDFIYFLGRFHVLVLHIPLGIIVALLVLELLARKEKYRHLEAASPFLWVAAAISAVFTVALGYMHFAEGAFEGPSAAQHRTFGTALAIILCVVAALRASPYAKNYKPVFLPASVLMVFLASITGHFGGNMTHGSTYLIEYAPQFMRSMMGLPPRRPPVESLGVADPWHDLVGPMLESRCSSCHNEDKREAELVLTSYEGIIAGGETGDAVVGGRPQFSELYHRITLEPDDEAFMPAEGKTPLTAAQTEIIRWWIEAGLPADTTMDQVEQKPQPDVEALIRTELGLGSGD